MIDHSEISVESITEQIIKQSLDEVVSRYDKSKSEFPVDRGLAKEILKEVFEQDSSDLFKELLLKLIITNCRDEPRLANDALLHALGLPVKIRYFLTQFESRYTFENVRKAAEVIGNHNADLTEKLVNQYRDWIYRDEDSET